MRIDDLLDESPDAVAAVVPAGEHLPAGEFLGCATPQAWLDAALAHLDVLLLDHANCEKKAASTAMNLLFRYSDKLPLLAAMSRLAREELLHFEQVMEILSERGIAWRPVSAARYATGLRAHARNEEPGRLIDALVIGAFIEARSCERFAALAPLLDDELARYYRFLLRSEARHYTDYLDLARHYARGIAGESVEARVVHFRAVEQALIEDADTEFRFHSGVPA